MKLICLGKELNIILLKNKYLRNFDFCCLWKPQKIKRYVIIITVLQNHKNLGFILNKTKPDVVGSTIHYLSHNIDGGDNLSAEINLKKIIYLIMYNVNARPLKICDKIIDFSIFNLIQSSSILVHGDHRIYSQKREI